MFDRTALKLLQPGLGRLAQGLSRLGISADALTVAGFVLSLAAAALIVAGQPLWALLPLLGGRLCDGLDGIVARLGQPSDRGAFLDIALDMLFYASIPLAFALAAPAANALAAAVLLAAFIGTATSFLAYATLAERRGLRSAEYPNKGFFYLGGLTEGSETILCFVLMCVWPQHFATIAYVFAALCAITIASRLSAGWSSLSPKD
jgi:phosphatidylglycerophosphate synthase